MINLIWAQSKNGVIAKDGAIPWKLKNDLENFKQLTMNQIILMGAKTYDSLPNKPLPNRINLVLSHKNQDQFVDQVKKVDSIEQAIQLANQLNKDLFIIGGLDLFQQTIKMADQLFVTIVDVDIAKGVELDIDLTDFKLINSEKFLPDTHNQYSFSINKYAK